MSGLDTRDVVNVSVTIEPLAAQYRNFGIGLMIGSTGGYIDTVERIRQYASLEGVGQDYPTNTPEYKAAAVFFAQAPQPAILKIGFWAQSATKGRLKGAALTGAQQLMSNFTGITTGSFIVSIDGVSRTITGVDFSSCTNLNGVASVLQTKLNAATPGTTCIWDSPRKRFVVTSPTTGASSTISYFTDAGSGVAIKDLLGMSAAAGASVPVAGIVAETLPAAVQLLADKTTAWYAALLAPANSVVDADVISAAQIIEGLGSKRTFFVTSAASGLQDGTASNDLASSLKVLGLSRTWVQYSTSSAYAAVSAFARAATVDFAANNTLLTLKFKQMPGVGYEELTETQAAVLRSKNANVFALYDNDTAILQEGVMANGYFFDEVFGTDWLANYVQTNVWNALYQSPTKIPQTDAGVNQLIAVVSDSCAQAVRNGLLAPGVWRGPNIGALKTGDYLPKGYYVYAQPVALQPQADREARKAPPIQVAVKLAGAIHFANVLIDVNR